MGQKGHCIIAIIESMINGIISLNNEDKGIGELWNLVQIVDQII
jgi:hypothetical protein